MSRESAQGMVEAAFKVAMEIINKYSDTDVSNASKIVAASNLVSCLLVVDSGVEEEEEN